MTAESSPQSPEQGAAHVPARIVGLVLHERGATFRARRMDAAALSAATDPWLAVDRFHIAAPTFPPHPHAGFSALTYVLPESPGTMRNRDSRSAHLMIPPGALHWTAAGSGILHEQIPADPTAPVEGLQIFLNLPAARQLDRPWIAHLESHEVAVVPFGNGSAARVLIGAYGTSAIGARCWCSPPKASDPLTVRSSPRRVPRGSPTSPPNSLTSLPCHPPKCRPKPPARPGRSGRRCYWASCSTGRRPVPALAERRSMDRWPIRFSKDVKGIAPHDTRPRHDRGCRSNR